MANQKRTAAWAVVAIIVSVVVAGALLFRPMLDGDRSDEVVIITTPTTAPDGDGPPVVVPPYDLPQLNPLPEAEVAPAGDPRVTRLIEGHNAWVDRLAGVTLRGGCVWSDGSPRESSERPRTMSIHWQPADETATVVCADDSCAWREGKVAISRGSSMHIDAHYLLMFRTYNPRDFQLSEVPTSAATQPAVRLLLVNGKGETLEFDEVTGRLLSAKMKLADGDAVVHFDVPASIPGSGGIQVPTVLRVSIPAIPPFGENAAPTIKFTVDVERSEFPGSGDGKDSQ